MTSHQRICKAPSQMPNSRPCRAIVFEDAVNVRFVSSCLQGGDVELDALHFKLT